MQDENLLTNCSVSTNIVKGNRMPQNAFHILFIYELLAIAEGHFDMPPGYCFFLFVWENAPLHGAHPPMQETTGIQKRRLHNEI